MMTNGIFDSQTGYNMILIKNGDKEYQSELWGG